MPGKAGLVAGLLLLTSPLAAQPKPAHYTCRRASSPIRIDGRLDDAAWARAPWTAYFIDIEGAKRPKPRYRTRAKMLWDDTYLYVAAELEEPDIRATLTEHDSVIFHDNDFEVFLNPSGDGRNYFEFEINALNTGWDLFLPKPYREGGKADNSWEIPGLLTEVSLNGTINNPADHDRGWTVEMAFPWTAFATRAPVTRPAAGDTWRANFSRVEWRHIPGEKESNWVWSPQGLIDMHVPAHWAYLHFVR
uniref:Carbohydrate-binding domain-containing protein n=1 Tax=Solibacter usitatus (strain Ellin6076) TaxID=234267 RepID=Q023Q6_SOLUE